ncbi:hypothetical protein [Halioxenophilus sp. WMMB6]|uniref:hypothetical protein n=1 Tax=Halioxenophilus sp. WMMB6 TaxID=3073815 RepID=UPI00295E8F4B|nr:hypothetical protein [Halioxenophilus sp. WMMB6]
MPASTETDSQTNAVFEREKKLLVEIWQALRLRLTDTGMEDALNVIPRPELAQYRLQVDPFDGSETLVGTWLDTHGSQTGEVQIRPNGSVYAEVDVVRDHPNDVRWFVESVTAWGNRQEIKTELRLLPAI